MKTVHELVAQLNRKNNEWLALRSSETEKILRLRDRGPKTYIIIFSEGNHGVQRPYGRFKDGLSLETAKAICETYGGRTDIAWKTLQGQSQYGEWVAL